MIEQLLLHLVGDYLFQTHRMARLKTQSFLVALEHAIAYSLLFLLIVPSLTAWLVILISHAVIDHYGVARYVAFFKNRLDDPYLTWDQCKQTGYPGDLPPHLSVWLLIITDNTLHLLINYAAIRWL